MTTNNSYGNDNRGIRRFLRENGVPPTVANVERIGKELRRTESQNDKVVKIHKEMEREHGIAATVDHKGDVHARVKRHVQRELEKRDR